MGYVYKITNTVNGKAYIGISVNEPTQGRIKEHLSGRGNRIIARAVKKYGKEVFTCKKNESCFMASFQMSVERHSKNGFVAGSGDMHVFIVMCSSVQFPVASNQWPVKEVFLQTLKSKAKKVFLPGLSETSYW